MVRDGVSATALSAMSGAGGGLSAVETAATVEGSSLEANASAVSGTLSGGSATVAGGSSSARVGAPGATLATTASGARREDAGLRDIPPGISAPAGGFTGADRV